MPSETQDMLCLLLRELLKNQFQKCTRKRSPSTSIRGCKTEESFTARCYYILGDKCLRNDTGKFAVMDDEVESLERALRLLNEENPWKKEAINIAQPVFGPCQEIDKERGQKGISIFQGGRGGCWLEIFEEGTFPYNV